MAIVYGGTYVHQVRFGLLAILPAVLMLGCDPTDSGEVDPIGTSGGQGGGGASGALGGNPNTPSPALGGRGGATSGAKWVGNITTSNAVRSDFLTYWDQITPENEGKWATVERTRDVMNWDSLQSVYSFAQQNGIPFKQHTLVWGKQAPTWLDDLSESEQKAEIEEWIKAFCEKFPDTKLIDAVNEPDHNTPTWIAALGGKGTTGHDWVIESFRLARTYCPNATLILNDYNVLRYNTDNFISIANKVKAAGYLDAVGCQAHSLEDQAFSELQANLQKIKNIGVDIYISEYDIDLADDTQQRDVMQQQFTLFYEEPAIRGITLWGYIHGSTWRDNTGLIEDGTARPALTWLMGYLGR
jgi:GH35 family endo-1,4-beta-xylanase